MLSLVEEWFKQSPYQHIVHKVNCNDFHLRLCLPGYVIQICLKPKSSSVKRVNSTYYSQAFKCERGKEIGES